jgi:L-asparaginase/Glu-tRNA(Gln) amidotransferase subunit D
MIRGSYGQPIYQPASDVVETDADADADAYAAVRAVCGAEAGERVVIRRVGSRRFRVKWLQRVEGRILDSVREVRSAYVAVAADGTVHNLTATRGKAVPSWAR